MSNCVRAPRAVPHLAFALLTLLCVLAAGRASAEPERESASEPRLVLPGGHEVRPGQLVQLTWEGADSVTELEILLSVDGGRHYDIWVSPELDPAQHHFSWRVPDVHGGTLRLRIRYNRGGREIEGAPTAALRTQPGEDPTGPLALPAAGGGEGESAPRPGNSQSAPAPGAARATLAESQSSANERTPQPHRVNHRQSVVDSSAALTVSSESRGLAATPGFVPLRI